MEHLTGWIGRRLRLDMTGRRFQIEPIRLDTLKQWIGGRGLNAAEASVDPGAAETEAFVCFASGPLNGTFAPVSGRVSVLAPSPPAAKRNKQFGPAFQQATIGGSFGGLMKLAGFDQIVVTGRADEPTLVLIENEQIFFRDAGHLWGLGAREATVTIWEEGVQADGSILAIGPAGESGLSSACLVNSLIVEEGTAGMGAVLGDKNLKALVLKGTGAVRIADPDRFSQAAFAMHRTLSRPGGPRLEISNTAGNIERIYWDPDSSSGGSFRNDPCWSCPLVRKVSGNQEAETGFPLCGGIDLSSCVVPVTEGTATRFNPQKAAADLGISMSAILANQASNSQKEICGSQAKGRAGWQEIFRQLHRSLMETDYPQKLRSIPDTETDRPDLQRVGCIADQLGGCRLTQGWWWDNNKWLERHCVLLQAATGWSASRDMLLQAADRTLGLERSFT